MYSWAILTLHTTNLRVERDGQIIADGTLLFDELKVPRYWEQHPHRPYPGYLHYWREQAFESEEARQAILSSAEHRLFINMVAEAYEMAKASAQAPADRAILWPRFQAAPWALFGWVIRNAANHDGLVEEPRPNAFPLSWNGLTLTMAMAGHALPVMQFFTMDKAFELVEDIARYADHDFNAPANATEPPRTAPAI